MSNIVISLEVTTTVDEDEEIVYIYTYDITQVLKHIFVCSIFRTENLYKVTYTRFQFP